MPLPRVSVIMNVCNGTTYLREALDSVLAQTFTDWEIILWDDRSTDDSAKIIAAYQDDRIRYFLSPEETPLGRARDLAIRQARGEWLAFLDQDDVWLPGKLQKQMALVDGDPKVGIIYGRTILFSAHARERDYDHWHEFQPLPEGDIFVRLFTDSCFIAMSSAVLRRSAVDEVGGIPDSIHVTPDCYCDVARARRHSARAVQEGVCRYRLHGANMSYFNYHRMHEEALWLIDQWAPCLDPQVVARRRRVHSTILAVEEMSHLSTVGIGIGRLLTRGSVAFLFSRPFARAFRAIRRRVCRPCWQTACDPRSAEDPVAAIAGQTRPERASHANVGRP